MEHYKMKPTRMSENPDIGNAEDEALDFNAGVDALAGILEPDEPDNQDQNPKAQKAETQESEEDAEEETLEAESDEQPEDSEEEGDEEEEESGADEETDEEETFELNDDLEIELEDGEKTTLKDLKEAKKQAVEFQRDYTRKTTELSQARDSFAKEQAEVAQKLAEQARSEREYNAQILQNFLPQKPDPRMIEEDPIGYQQSMAYYDHAMEQYHGLRQRLEYDKQQREEQLLQADEEFLQQQKRTLLERMPELKDPKRYQSFVSDINNVFAKSYGFSQAELSTVRDARFAEVMRDAIAYRKLQESKPKAKAKLEGKPKMLRGSKRQSPNATRVKAAQQRKQKLMQTGSLEDAVNSLMDFDL